MRMVLAAVAALSMSGAALAAPAAIVVDKPEIRASLGNVPTAAAYLTIRNTGAAPDRLLGATCACAASITLHQSVTQNGVARMTPQASVAVPAGGSAVFAPAGPHLMLTGLKAPIRAGAKVPVVLRFEKAGRVAVTFTAVDAPAAAMAGMDHSAMHH